LKIHRANGLGYKMLMSTAGTTGDCGCSGFDGTGKYS
jgi:hypothetical protein